MVHRGAKPREPKHLSVRVESTLADKLRRHRNKKRIWRRCVARLAQLDFVSVTYDATSLEAAS